MRQLVFSQAECEKGIQFLLIGKKIMNPDICVDIQHKCWMSKMVCDPPPSAPQACSDEYKKLAEKICNPCWEKPPCLPPIPQSNEDQSRGYQVLNQRQVHFTYVLLNLRSCAEPRDLSRITLPSLIGIPRRPQSTEPHGYRWQAMPWHTMATLQY